jgi:hypothetical protein
LVPSNHIYGKEHHAVKAVQEDKDKLNNEQSITLPLAKVVADDQLITITITDDSHPPSVEELSSPPNHSTSTPSLDKTSIKPKNKCSNCQIL